MKVIVKPEGKFTMKIPVPLFVAKHVLKLMLNRKLLSSQRENIYLIQQIVEICYNELKQYKGLKLVEVRSSDGTVVLIKV